MTQDKKYQFGLINNEIINLFPAKEHMKKVK